MTSDPTQTHDEPESRREGDATREAEGPRGEVAPREDSARRPERADGEPGNVLRLQPRLMPRADGLYYVSEILAYHDEAFVEAAFAAVLRRAPAEEEARNALADLRGGAREKIDILRDLARSAEGKGQAAFERIAGLKRSRLAEWARGLPVVGHLWQILTAIIRLPVALRHQRQFEAYALAQQQRIADHVNSQRMADAVASELQLAVADATAALSLLSDALAETTARHAERQSHLARRLDDAALRLDEAERRLDEHGHRLDAQQEFLINEQRAIVEAQKSALASAEEDLRETTAEQRRELDALAARVDELRAAIVTARESVGGQA